MQFSTQQFIKPGSAVVIHSQDLDDIFHREAVHHGCLAEVVWCQRCTDSCSSRFSVGVQFLRPGVSDPLPALKSTEVLKPPLKSDANDCLSDL